MKKITLTSVVAIMIACPIFADTLNQNSKCDDDTLYTTTGPATINAKWSANTIILNWQPGNDATFTAPVQGNAAYSCEYDGGITLPTAPTRSGYTFGGWRVAQSQQQQQCSLSSVWTSGMANESIDWDATHTRWKPIVNTGYTMTDVFGEDNSNDLSAGEWAVLFNSGELKGRALCSTTNGTPLQTGNPAETGDEAVYCWCAGTSFGDQCSVLSPSWVFSVAMTATEDTCVNLCAPTCANNVYDGPVFRRAIFGVTE